MRSLVLLLATVSLVPAAQAGCKAEAQFIASVASTQIVDAKTCKAMIDVPRFFAASQVCPLYLSTIMKVGITLPRLANGACGVAAGAELSGVAVLEEGASSIILD